MTIETRRLQVSTSEFGGPILPQLRPERHIRDRHIRELSHELFHDKWVITESNQLTNGGVAHTTSFHIAKPHPVFTDQVASREAATHHRIEDPAKILASILKQRENFAQLFGIYPNIVSMSEHYKKFLRTLSPSHALSIDQNRIADMQVKIRFPFHEPVVGLELNPHLT